MTVLYKLAREQLSKAPHYDFGLRALKSVLVMAGALKRAAPATPEALVLMRALRDMNLPKFVFDDVPLFLGLVHDLFPGTALPVSLYPFAYCAAKAAPRFSVQLRCWQTSSTAACQHGMPKIDVPNALSGMDCPRLRYDELSDAAEAELAERGLQVLEHQVDKVVQLHEARPFLLRRHGRAPCGRLSHGYQPACAPLKSSMHPSMSCASSKHRTTAEKD